MSNGKDEQPQTEQAQVLAQVAIHPSDGKPIVMLSDALPQEQRAEFCFGVAQTFIGLGVSLLKRKKSPIVLPKLEVRGPLV